ncbi:MULTISPECIES: hypothetical protein [Streptomyces]|uniref:Integral membrane protein n=1 Tax=Streptomyces koelreuteriae TaxID=2838015 RepID=A0ABX8FPY3_9ACTN|nr:MULTISPECIES: hypothetical protein [Streptomyces]QWB23213.1 hypothetical protein KJK29_11730 [Streptomyces koelreuteriae]UUA06164.1 hypothetical protein NNW98_11785 [Streptomyces koelreuteriae]UUA13792.1 hypothetical protein NNW99_11785 [Streptomyces sp. CRCS-T-1]
MNDLGELDRPGTPAGPGTSAGTGASDAPSERALGPAATASPAPEPAADRESPGKREPADGREASVAQGQAADRKPPSARRGADPVKALMHRHRELCERAVDPLEIAAGLEAHGITERTAARFRHRDVFSLAEEMYARVTRDGDAPASPAPTAPRARADWVLLTLLPGALCAAAVNAAHLTHGRTRLIAVAAGILAVGLALRAALRRGPLSRTDHTGPRGSALWISWLVAYSVLGDGLLHSAVTGGPDGPPTGAAGGSWPLAVAPVLALALACAPAAWTAHLFTARGRRRLAASRGLEDFAAAVRPLLLGTVALFLGALAGLLALCAAVLDEPADHAEVLALGALLFIARLLTTHCFPYAPAAVLAATATVQAAALATVFIARLPGLGFLGTPVETLVTLWGAGSVPTLACGAAALTLLVHATRRLTRASAHAPPVPSR